jgi:hypothetical protein
MEEKQQVNPHILKMMSHFNMLVQTNQLVGIAVVGIGPNGEVHSSPCIPGHPGVIHLMIGALSCLEEDLIGQIKQLRTQVQPSPIIRAAGVR